MTGDRNGAGRGPTAVGGGLHDRPDSLTRNSPKRRRFVQFVSKGLPLLERRVLACHPFHIAVVAHHSDSAFVRWTHSSRCQARRR